LYRVAYRIARRLKGRQARRYGREREVHEVPAAEGTPEWVWREVGVLLDEEVNRLPQKYRLPFILCYLDGKTNEEAARQLACPVGTLASRLAWARERLRGRLTRRGVTLLTGLLAGALTAHAGPVAVPGRLAEATTRTGLRFAAGQAAPAGARPVQLAREYLTGVLRGRLLRGAAGALALGAGIAVVLWLFALLRPGRPPASAQDDLKQFQGGWRVVEPELAGKRDTPVDGRALVAVSAVFGLMRPDGRPWNGLGPVAAAETMSKADTRLVFIGKTGRLEAGGDTFPMTFELDPTREPKTIDLVLAWLGNTPARGIYALEGDELTICYSWDGLPRPTAFATHRGAREILYKFRRE
jgi:uncharacterized protein (TIGR03067 family)